MAVGTIYCLNGCVFFLWLCLVVFGLSHSQRLISAVIFIQLGKGKKTNHFVALLVVLAAVNTNQESCLTAFAMKLPSF